jgi:hypothetical protein
MNFSSINYFKNSSFLFFRVSYNLKYQNIQEFKKKKKNKVKFIYFIFYTKEILYFKSMELKVIYFFNLKKMVKKKLYHLKLKIKTIFF